MSAARLKPGKSVLDVANALCLTKTFSSTARRRRMQGTNTLR